ncbi:class I SAM-dependent methyltransferase [Mycolicibacterium hodleri]|uniref:Class I SAM-dependent methyltransferase n=1 Tax=Mycolicibacterium hodleri TaxID=49897 RepID=A0A502EG51_9MYCO|nr:class I SAM-dependent methyltransferase [Mycolicibacterium hodleri]TPG36668.1 class I SAM-dependent methyltransferase [Mycolicibacterium hodleri]
MTETPSIEPCAEHATSRSSAAWLQLMARIYDPFLWWGERAGMRLLRSKLLHDASGSVLEIGAGTGLNIPHYPDDVGGRLVLSEPEPGMRRRLVRRLEHSGCVARVIDAPAERLPLADASVDTVVTTLVLCTVDDPERALREIARVLRPGGQVLFIEHVRSNSQRLAAWQDRLREPWRRFAGGCVCNRSTADLMGACGFTVVAYNVAWRGMPPIVRPLLMGRATLT